MENSVGKLLRKWRTHQRFSQLQLALELDISSKHISFLETGRSLPSKSMILKLSNFLSISKRETNKALLSAGHAPVFSEQDIDLVSSTVNLKPIISAMDKLISSHMPYPAFVFNQHWDIIKANKSGADLIVALGFCGSTNLIEALINDDPETSKISNWHQTVAELLRRLRIECRELGSSERLTSLEKRLSDCLPKNYQEKLSENNSMALSTQFNFTGEILSLFSVMAHLGSIQDIVISEFKIELMFPTDQKTTEYYDNLKRDNLKQDKNQNVINA